MQEQVQEKKQELEQWPKEEQKQIQVEGQEKKRE